MSIILLGTTEAVHKLMYLLVHVQLNSYFIAYHNDIAILLSGTDTRIKKLKYLIFVPRI
jgi:hypothetical protein